MTATDKLKIVAFLAGALLLSYGIARMGEPQSAWLWCTVGRLC